MCRLILMIITCDGKGGDEEEAWDVREVKKGVRNGELVLLDARASSCPLTSKGTASCMHAAQQRWMSTAFQ
jgi:hypothetical protein